MSRTSPAAAARRVPADLADALEAARAVGEGRVGRLRVGFAASLALTVLPDVLRAFRERFLGVRLDIREMTTYAGRGRLVGERP